MPWFGLNKLHCWMTWDNQHCSPRKLTEYTETENIYKTLLCFVNLGVKLMWPNYILNCFNFFVLAFFYLNFEMHCSGIICFVFWSRNYSHLFSFHCLHSANGIWYVIDCFRWKQSKLDGLRPSRYVFITSLLVVCFFFYFRFLFFIVNCNFFPNWAFSITFEYTHSYILHSLDIDRTGRVQTKQLGFCTKFTTKLSLFKLFC